MLTADLVRATVRGGVIRPTFLKPGDASLLQAAEEMVEAVKAAASSHAERGALEEALDDVIGPSRRARVLKGLAKLLLDRCAFETESPEPPPALRQRVFRAAHAVGPLALEQGPMGRPTAADVLKTVGDALGLPPDAVARALYADLPSAQRLMQARLLTPEALLHRYNLALVQAIVLHAEELVLQVHKPSPARLRQLLQHARFCRLMVRARRDGDVLVLALDGPGALFRRSTAYGLDLARFVSAVPRLDVPWTLAAPVRWGRSKRAVVLEIDHGDGLVSHLRDAGGHRAPEVQQLLDRWPADAALQPSDAVQPVDLGGRGLLMPDVAFTDGARTAYLEVAGWWRKDWLDRHLEGLRRHGRDDVVLAVSRKMCVDKDLSDLPGEIVDFAAVLPVGRLRDALERVAR